MLVELSKEEALSLHHFAHDALQLELHTRAGVKLMVNNSFVYKKAENMDLHYLSEALRKLRKELY